MTAGFGRSYVGNITGIVAVGVALAFFVPSTMGRIVILMPIVLELAENQGFESGSRGRDGFVVALLFGTLLPAFALLPSNLPNIILTRCSRNAARHHADLWRVHLAAFPSARCCQSDIDDRSHRCDVFRCTESRGSDAATNPVFERRTPPCSHSRCHPPAVDDGFMAWYRPGWIGLAAGSACLLPGFGVLKADVVDKLNYGALLYVAGIIGLGAMISTSGLGDRVGALLLDGVGFLPGESIRNLSAMTGISIVTGFLATQAGVPAILTPISGGIAEAMDLPLATVLMMQVLGFSSVVLPYQVPPLMVGLSLAGVSVATATRFSLTLFVPTVLILLPLDYLWWRILGYLP